MYQKITYYSRISQTLHVPVPAAVGGWTPANLASLVAWYKADTDVTTDGGGNVQSVVDQAHNYNLHNDNTGNPGEANGGNVTLSTINGRAAFNFVVANGTVLRTNQTVVNLGNSSFCLFAVLTRTAATPNNGSPLTFLGPNSTWFSATDSIGFTQDGSNAAVGFFHVSTEYGVGALANDTPGRYGVVGNGATIVGYLNDGANTGTSAVSADVLSGTGTIILGGAGTSGAGPSITLGNLWDGLIGEVVVTNSEPSSGDLTNLNNYFGTRFGL